VVTRGGTVGEQPRQLRQCLVTTRRERAGGRPGGVLGSVALASTRSRSWTVPAFVALVCSTAAVHPDRDGGPAPLPARLCAVRAAVEMSRLRCAPPSSAPPLAVVATGLVWESSPSRWAVTLGALEFLAPRARPLRIRRAWLRPNAAKAATSPRHLLGTTTKLVPSYRTRSPTPNSVRRHGRRRAPPRTIPRPIIGSAT